MVLVAGPGRTGKTKVLEIAIQILIATGLPVLSCAPDNNTADDLTIRVDILSKFNSLTEQAVIIRVHCVTTEKDAIDAGGNTLKGKIAVDGEGPKVEPEAELLGVALMVHEAFHATQKPPHGVADRSYKLSTLSLATWMLGIAGIIDKETPHPEADSNRHKRRRQLGRNNPRFLKEWKSRRFTEFFHRQVDRSDFDDEEKK